MKSTVAKNQNEQAIQTAKVLTDKPFLSICRDMGQSKNKKRQSTNVNTVSATANKE